MTQAIPRALVAEVLSTDVDQLPEGDLPLDRLAARFLSFLRAGDEDTPPRDDHPDAWTLPLFVGLTRDHPTLGLAATVAALAACDTPEDVAAIAAGPLEDLIAQHGPSLFDRIEPLAVRAPRFAYALSGVWRPDGIPPLLWARVEALGRSGPQLDDGDAMPPPTGL